MAKIQFFGKNTVLSLVFLCLLVGCQKTTKIVSKDNAAFVAPQANEDLGVWGKIKNSGELIWATMSGPNTYFEFHGREMGLQYGFASHFAQGEGLRVRVELVRDTLELVQKLKAGEVDVAGVLLSAQTLEKEGLLAAGVKDSTGQQSWAVGEKSKDLAKMLDDWYSLDVQKAVKGQVKEQMENRGRVTRKVYSPFLSRSTGKISEYDDLFKRAASTAGCDWTLVAAMCYQESCFDPQAQSWAGAKGLMQLMPATAASVGLSEEKIFDPAENVEASGRVIKGLFSSLSDIKSPDERVKFMLASYNGGIGHIRDAMALARKEGRDTQVWSEVAPYVLRLSDPAYYRDPVVKYGYMIGQETYNYVNEVCERYRSYGGDLGSVSPASKSTRSEESSTPHRASPSKAKRTEHKVYTPDDPEFFKMQSEE
jgi:membrane-bound lytic murein transglycosylase F